MHGYCPRCRKRAYLSEHHANTIAMVIAALHSRELYAYRCPGGYGWHLSKQQRRRLASDAATE